MIFTILQWVSDISLGWTQMDITILTVLESNARLSCSYINNLSTRRPDGSSQTMMGTRYWQLPCHSLPPKMYPRPRCMIWLFWVWWYPFVSYEASLPHPWIHCSCTFVFTSATTYINVIQPALLAEWHPGFKQVIANWITTGPTGNVMPFQHYFASYHDLQVSDSIVWYCTFSHCAPQAGRLREHDQHIHDAMAVQMLFRAVVGLEPPTHPKIQAFRHGFVLPCSNGFRFTEVCCCDNFWVVISFCPGS